MYAFGPHKKFQEINQYFKYSFSETYITLKKPGLLLTKTQANLLSLSPQTTTSAGILNATLAQSTSAKTATKSTKTIVLQPNVNMIDTNNVEGEQNS